MIESRPLKEEEIEDLLISAPIDETRNLIKFLSVRKEQPYDFFNHHSVFSFGLISNGRPIYFAYILPNKNNEYELWTVVNKDVKEQFSLYKYSKRSLDYALTLYSPIYATMEKCNARNVKWVIHLGFKKIYDNGTIIKFKIGE